MCQYGVFCCCIDNTDILTLIYVTKKKSITERVFIGSVSELSILQILSMRIVFLDDVKNIGEVVRQLSIFDKHANFIKTTPEVSVTK